MLSEAMLDWLFHFRLDQPKVVQLRLADYRRTLRRNNGVIDPECQTFALWMSGSYHFTIDDIRFVHDPEIPGAQRDRQ